MRSKRRARKGVSRLGHVEGHVEGDDVAHRADPLVRPCGARPLDGGGDERAHLEQPPGEQGLSPYERALHSPQKKRPSQPRRFEPHPNAGEVVPVRLVDAPRLVEGHRDIVLDGLRAQSVFWGVRAGDGGGAPSGGPRVVAEETEEEGERRNRGGEGEGASYRGDHREGDAEPPQGPGGLGEPPAEAAGVRKRSEATANGPGSEHAGGGGRGKVVRVRLLPPM